MKIVRKNITDSHIKKSYLWYKVKAELDMEKEVITITRKTFSYGHGNWEEENEVCSPYGSPARGDFPCVAGFKTQDQSLIPKDIEQQLINKILSNMQDKIKGLRSRLEGISSVIDEYKVGAEALSEVDVHLTATTEEVTEYLKDEGVKL